MSGRRAVWWAVMVWLLGAWVLPVAAAPVQRALLIGVSELANQPQALWLQAPRNDVRAVRQALLRAGFAPTHLTVLADEGVPRQPAATQPTAANIRRALAQLAEQSQAGDFVFLYWSGHGTRIRGRPKRHGEADGLSEVFLARDAGAWNTLARDVPGALRDDEIDAAITRILQRGAFVWTVFDTCSAQSLTRSAGQGSARDRDDPVRYRGLDVDQLQAASVAPAAGQGTGAAPGLRVAVADPQGTLQLDSVLRQRYVAFFASESHEAAPELKLPRGQPSAQPHGLMTWALLQALRQPAASYRSLFGDLLTHYRPVAQELAARFPLRDPPTPVMEGAMDAAPFSSLATATVARTWPVARSPGAADTWQLPVGLLDGITPGMRLTGVEAAADWRGDVIQVGDHASVVRLPARADVLPRVQLAPGAAGPGAVSVALGAQAQAAVSLPSLALPFPLALAEAPRRQADLYVEAAAGGGWHVRPQSAAVRALLPDAGVVVADLGELRARLGDVARRLWLNALARRYQGRSIAGVALTLATPGSGGLQTAQSLLETPGAARVRAGEPMTFVLSNASDRSLDLVLLHADSQGRITRLYPRGIDEANRFERGSTQAPSALAFRLTTGTSLTGEAARGRAYLIPTPSLAQDEKAPTGTPARLPRGTYFQETLILVAATAQAQSLPRDFGLLAGLPEAGFAQATGVAGAAATAMARSGAATAPNDVLVRVITLHITD